MVMVVILAAMRVRGQAAFPRLGDHCLRLRRWHWPDR